MKHNTPILFTLATLALCSSAFAGEQLRNLFTVPANERTKLPLEKTWPEKPGEAALCMWRDDKTAAVSYGIDDNCASNIDWWFNETEKRGIHMTWFLITERIGTADRPHMNATWERWKQVQAKGHALEAHSMTHLAGCADMATWKGIDWEYSESLKLINENIGNGWKATCLAYPGGKNSVHNSYEAAAKYVIAGRGGRGSPNPAQGIDYLNTCAMSSHNLGEKPEQPWSNVYNMFGPATRNNAYRGWAVLFWHFINEKDEASMDEARRTLDFYVKNKDKLWHDVYAEVARYGQERETATLTTGGSAETGFELTLTDRMDDTLFNTPLTVKLRLPDTWTAVTAMQGKKPARTTLLQHEGASYALVDVVPDAGTVLVKQAK